MSNRVRLSDLFDMDVKDIAKLPLDQISHLFDDLADLEAEAKRYKIILEITMAIRFADKAAAERKAKDKDTGTITIREDGFSIACDLPKTVSWDEDGLIQAENELIGMGEPVDEYIKIKRTVSEAAYNNWPQSLRAMFQPHRTVGAGKPTYKFVKKESK